MGKYLAFCTLALLYVSALADDVVVLTEDNFEKEVGQAKGSLVEFSTPWCGHCKKLAPEYEKLGSSFKEAKSVLIGKVDCDEHKSLCSKYGVSEYPTIQWFPKGSLEPKKYEGPRNAESLAEFVNAEGGIKVHGDPYSPSTMRVVAALYEKELEFEFVPVDLGTGEHKKEHFLLLNPFGQVPAFEDGDLKLFESRAITQHIAHEYADKGTQLLCPGSKKDAAALLVGMEVEIHQYDAEASKLVREQIVKPLMGGTTDPAVVEEHEAKLAKVLDVYEARLTQFKYLASDSFTLVDLHHLPTVQYLSWTPTKKLFDSRPHVSAWVSDITSRPAWAKVLALQKK